MTTPAPATPPRGALSPNLAEQLDKLADQGRTDRLLSQLGINPADQFGANPDVTEGQLELFTQSEDGETFVAHDGQTL